MVFRIQCLLGTYRNQIIHILVYVIITVSRFLIVYAQVHFCTNLYSKFKAEFKVRDLNYKLLLLN